MTDLISSVPAGPLLVALEFLSLRGLSRALRACREFRRLIDTHEHLWTHQFTRYAATREYVVPALRALSQGKARVMQSEGAFYPFYPVF